MQRKHWRRLNKAEAELQPKDDESGVVFFPLKGESESEYAARIDRWKDGGKVEGVDRPCADGGYRIGKVVFVSANKKR